MLKIGMDRTDRQFRKFEYDDERKYGNPGAEMFKVLYEESGVFGEVLCSNVISIKKSLNTHNHFLDIPLYKEGKSVETPKVEQPVIENKSSEPVVEEKKKIKSTKTKSKAMPLKGEPIENKEISLNVLDASPKSYKYEYDVLVIDNITYADDIKCKLNDLGKDGWEVCGFQTVQKMFGGIQAVIIMKKGLN